MIPAKIQIECPVCQKQQLKQLNVSKIESAWSVGTTYQCALPENGEDGGCGAVLAISYRSILETKITVIDSSNEVQGSLL